MPSRNKHLKRAQRHHQVADKLAGDLDTLGWAAVVLFYAARDMVHAVFDADPDLAQVCRHPTSHTRQDLDAPGTNVVIKRHYRVFESPYMDLYGVSVGARYEGQQVTEALYAELRTDFADLEHQVVWHLNHWGCTVPDWMV